MQRPITTPMPAPDGWTAQRYHGQGDSKDYVCPRCTRTVASTSQHVLAWPTDPGSDVRRHWHTKCWESATKEGLDPYRWG